jgi:hypothetical protein
LDWFFKTANEFFKTANVIRKIANELGIEKRNT